MTKIVINYVAVRQIIKAEADRHGAKYRITKSGQVDFFGVMPNTSLDGWYFAHYNADDYAEQIQRDMENASFSVRELMASA